MEQYEQDIQDQPQRVPSNQSGRLSNVSGKRSIRPTPKQSQRKINSRQNSANSLQQSQKSQIQQQEEMAQQQYEYEQQQQQLEDDEEMGLDQENNNNKELVDINEGRLEEYEEDEDDFVCARFPHLDFCACKEQSTIAVVQSQLIELFNNVYIGDFVAGLSVKKMLQHGITHVLNVSALEYKKRTKYFKYLNIDVYDKSDEDIKKHFRITNRFISEALQNGGKILIHDQTGVNIAPAFALAFLINNEKIPLKNGLEIVQQSQPKVEIKPNFWKQLERYDLEKLALITLNKKE